MNDPDYDLLRADATRADAIRLATDPNLPKVGEMMGVTLDSLKAALDKIVHEGPDCEVSLDALRRCKQ